MKCGGELSDLNVGSVVWMIELWGSIVNALPCAWANVRRFMVIINLVGCRVSKAEFSLFSL